MSKSLFFGIVIGGAVVAALYHAETKKTYAKVKEPEVKEAETETEEPTVEDDIKDIKKKVKAKANRAWNKFCSFAIRHQTEITVVGGAVSVLLDILAKLITVNKVVKEAVYA